MATGIIRDSDSGISALREAHPHSIAHPAVQYWITARCLRRDNPLVPIHGQVRSQSDVEERWIRIKIDKRRAHLLIATISRGFPRCPIPPLSTASAGFERFPWGCEASPGVSAGWFDCSSSCRASLLGDRDLPHYILEQFLRYINVAVKVTVVVVVIIYNNTCHSHFLRAYIQYIWWWAPPRSADNNYPTVVHCIIYHDIVCCIYL